LLSKQGIDLTNGSPGIFEMLAFKSLYDDAMGGWPFEDAISKLHCLSDLIADNPRMAPLRAAILAIEDADRTLATAMSALREI